jgi:hypothetical protein
MAYEGDPKSMKVTVKNGSEIIPTIITKFQKKDSVQVWLKPIKADSLQVFVEKDTFKKDFMVKIKKLKVDTLSVSADFNGTLPLRERFALSSSAPLVKFDKSKIFVFNKDSIAITFETEYDDFQQKLYLNFQKEPLEQYKIQLMPGALTDFYEKSNDTLTYRISTKNASDYGNLKVILENVKRYPVIVELTNKDGKVKATEYTESSPTIEFLALEPDIYTLRIIYDDNKNKVWDTGSYMEKRQSEEVIYFPKEIDVRANWDVEQPFNVGVK